MAGIFSCVFVESEPVKIRESAILAIGAIAEGCGESLAAHMEQLFPYLISMLRDGKALVRSITCWTLSRFSSWVVAQPDQRRFLQPMMHEILQRVLDRNKKVQEAAVSAFATLEEEAQEHLVPYLLPILQNLMFAFETFQVCFIAVPVL